MSWLASWLVVPLGVLVGAGCDGVKASRSDARPEASSSPSVAPPPMPAPVADAAPIEAGPAALDASVSREERERAVLALLAGGEPANRLLHAAVEPGQEFDPGQRDRVAPPWRPPVVKMIGTTVAGRLPTEVIERIVRQNMGRFRLCYENGLRTNAELGGQIIVHFAIDKTGSVETADSPSATLSDPVVVACVVRGFANLSFPEPENKAKVQVKSTVLFESSDP